MHQVYEYIQVVPPVSGFLTTAYSLLLSHQTKSVTKPLLTTAFSLLLSHQTKYVTKQMFLKVNYMTQTHAIKMLKIVRKEALLKIL